jgi:cellulose synthase (UDP-forming)
MTTTTTRLVNHWGSVGEKTGYWAMLLRLLIYCALLGLAWECISMVYRWPEQAVLAIATILVGYLIHRISGSEATTLALMLASLISTARYAYWRITTVWTAIATNARGIGIINIIFMLILLSAEFYAFVILTLGYFQSIRPLRRPPIAMPDDIDEWPHIDVLIPTYNEDLTIVRTTAIAAMNMDYPHDKLHVFVLDDGRREAFREFCESAGVGYITRNDNKHAKAGNINAALKTMSAPYAAIFDCDHIPTRSFLQMTLAWFQKDRKLGMMQTPHFFYSPDPFERNLDSFMEIPNESELFYGLIQDCNDLWNATFFCGSCAILRRAALDEIGGIAVETVTEDAHTSLRMQSVGWNTAYINIPQAAGLATDSLAGHIGQRIRWARGMIQILRTDNPLFRKGLAPSQRLCYTNAMIHFLYAGPRLIFLISPLLYMVLGFNNIIPGYWVAILVYVAPHLFLANLANFRMQGKYRYSFWNEVYETVLAPYIIGPTLLALINPKLGKFNVTAKGGIVDRSYFDSVIARPYVFLILLNVLGLLMAPIRFFWWNSGHPGTIVMNVIWILFNMVILGTANAVAYESKQTRGDVRIATRKRVAIELEDGSRIAGETVDMSLSGARLSLLEMPALDKGTRIRVVFPQREGEAVFPAQIVAAEDNEVRLTFGQLSEREHELLTLVLYGDADAWLSRMEYRKTDRPMHSFGRLMRLSVRGVYWALFGWVPRKKQSAAAGALVALVMLLAGAARAQAPYIPPLKPSPILAANNVPGASTANSGIYSSAFTLKDIGVPQAILFRGIDASQSIPFSLPRTAVVSKAVLKLHYAFSPSLIPQLSHLNIMLNGALVATLPVPQNTGQMRKEIDAEIPLPSEMIIRDNVLRFQSVAHYTVECEDPSSYSALWSRVENTSRIELSGVMTDVADDLKILPLPFYDGSVGSDTATIPMIFASQPDKPSLNAAGVVASWFGLLIKSKPLNFPVIFGANFPRGNAVLLVENAKLLPPGLNLQVRGPVLAMRTNPVDQYGKILIVAGTSPEQLLTAAQALATGSVILQGDTAEIGQFKLPDPRGADDAPLWLPTNRNVPFWDYSSTTQLQSDGSAPVAVYLRMPPDLYFGDRNVLMMRVNYRYNAISLANESTLRIDANGSMVQQLPMPHEDNPHGQLTNEVAIPLANMRPFANTMLFNFYFQIAKKGNCQDTPPINLQGAILRDSYLNIKGLYHWAAMPNLELFSNAGFPFTRYADLAQTRIVLPPQATGSEVGFYLSLMGYFGERTGYPAVRVQVADPSELGQDVDYLVLGTASDQPAFEKLNDKLPVAVHPNGYTIQDSSGIFHALEHKWWQVAEMRPQWWWKLGKDEGRSGVIESVGSLPDAIIQGIESPWAHERSVVTITLKQSESAAPFTAALWKVSESSDISESVSVLHGSTFTSYRVGDRFYHVGSLPWWEHLRHWFVQFPWIIVPFTFILGLFIVPWIRLRLDRRTKKRLNPPPEVSE